MTGTCELPDALRDLPASRTVVYHVLANADGPVASGDLPDRTGLSADTVSLATQDLVDAGLVRSETDPQDARRKRFTVNSSENT